MPWTKGVLTPADPRQPKQLRLPRLPAPVKKERGWNLKPEEKLQIDIVNWIRWVAPHVRLFAVRNEGDRGAVGHSIAVSMGLKPGMTDLIVEAPVKDHWEPYHIEVKTALGRLTDLQEEFKMECAKDGRHHAVVRSIEDVRQAFLFWGIKTREHATV